MQVPLPAAALMRRNTGHPRPAPQNGPGVDGQQAIRSVVTLT